MTDDIQQRLTDLARALNTLPLFEREVVVYHYYDGLTLEEVAEHFDTDVEEVKAAHAKALETLQALWRY